MLKAHMLFFVWLFVIFVCLVLFFGVFNVRLFCFGCFFFVGKGFQCIFFSLKVTALLLK